MLLIPGCMMVLNNSYVITQPGMLSATISKTDIYMQRAITMDQ